MIGLERGMGVSPMCTTGVSPVLLAILAEEEEEEEASTARMAVVHTGKMPVPQFMKRLPSRLDPGAVQ